jgi:hypothetical protein
MDAAGFWKIIERSRAGFDPRRRDGNQAQQVRRLEKLLAALPAREIVAFERQRGRRMAETYRRDLWGAAYIINGGCGDDGFMDFRTWLISMGRKVYQAALRDPESLLDVADAPGVELPLFEDFAYVGRQVYLRKTKQELPASRARQPAKPAGKDWTEDDLPGRFPKLWAKYGDNPL